MRLRSIGFAISMTSLSACAQPLPPPASADNAAAYECSAAPAAEPSAPPPPNAASGADSSPYQGHGAESIAPELLEKFRPRPLAAAVSRRLQSLLDVRAPDVGRLAPDGKALFFGWSISGVRQVWKIDGPGRFPEQLTGGEDRTSLAAITPDGTQLVLQRDRKGDENPGLYLQPRAGGPLQTIQQLDGVQSHFEIISDDGKALYFSANDRDRAQYVVYRYDFASKQISPAFEAEPALWHVADVKDDGRLLVVKATGSLSSEFFEWNPKTHALTPLFGQNEHEEYQAQYGARDGELIVLTNKFDEFRRLYRFTNGQWAPLTEAIGFDIEHFSIDRPRRRIAYGVNERGYSRLHALDAKTGKPLPLPRLPDADHVMLGPTTPNGRFSTLGIDDGRHPLQGYVLDWQSNTLSKWHTPSAPEFDTSSFARAELENYPARDGTPIPAFVRKPSACSAACPVVIAFHGGPEAQARPGFDVASQIFVDAGFVFVEPNVRGSDGYGKTWLHADDAAKRLDVITDIEDAARWARTRFAVAGQTPRVGIYGWSYGGYSVLMGMTMFAGAYDAGVDLVGISDLRTFLQNTAPYRRILRVSEYGDPERDAAALEKLSPLTYVDRVRAPLLIEQGASDPRVPAGEAIQLYERLKSRNLECELALYADEGHGASKRSNLVLMLGHTIEFFQRHLAGPGQRSSVAAAAY
jgi:protease II